MSRSRLYFWFGIFALGTIGFSGVQDWIRPVYKSGNGVTNYLIGVAPNFFAAIALPAFLYPLINTIVTDRQDVPANIWLVERAHLTSIVISVTGLFGSLSSHLPQEAGLMWAT
jgi:hypothetical protein